MSTAPTCPTCTMTMMRLRRPKHPQANPNRESDWTDATEWTCIACGPTNPTRMRATASSSAPALLEPSEKARRLVSVFQAAPLAYEQWERKDGAKLDLLSYVAQLEAATDVLRRQPGCPGSYCKAVIKWEAEREEALAALDEEKP